MEPDPAHTFKIITPKRPFLLCAPSEEEEIKWLSAVRALIARRTAPGEGPIAGPSTSASASAGMQMGTSMSASTSGGGSGSGTRGDPRLEASSSRGRQVPPTLAIIPDDESEDHQHEGVQGASAARQPL